MSLWDDFWESFFGGFAQGAASAQAGAATGFAIGSLGGETAARAGAAFGASVGGQVLSGAVATQDLPYSGLPTESPITPEQKQQLGQQAAAADQEQVWTYQTTGEVFGPMIDLDAPDQTTESTQWEVSSEQSQESVAKGMAQQQSQPSQPDYQELKKFQDVLRSDYSGEYLAKVTPVAEVIGPPLPPGETAELPHIVDSAPPPLLAPPPSPSPALPGPSLLDELARSYGGGDIHTPDTYTPSIDEIMYDAGIAADPPAQYPQYAGGVDVVLPMGSFGNVPVPDFFPSPATLGSYWTDAHAFVESQLPTKGTWQRGFARALGESALSAFPPYRVYGLWSSAYDVTQKPGGLDIGNVYVWWQANTNPVMGMLSTIVDAGMAADSNNDEEVTRNATHLLLMLVGMLLGGRAGGGGGKGGGGAGRKGGGGPLLESEAGAGVGEGLGETGAGEGAGKGAGEAGAGEGAGKGAGASGAGEGAGGLPPWAKPTPKPTPGKVGRVIETRGTFGKNERPLVNMLKDEGRTVEAIERTEKEGERLPDSYVDGVRTEFKTPKKGATHGTIKNQISSSVQNGGQARNMMIDARGSGLTVENAVRGIARIRTETMGRLDEVRIVGDGFDLTFTDFK